MLKRIVLLWPQLKCTAQALAKSFIFTAFDWLKKKKIFKVSEQETKSEKDFEEQLLPSIYCSQFNWRRYNGDMTFKAKFVLFFYLSKKDPTVNITHSKSSICRK